MSDKEYIKINRAISRAEEIKTHGKLISTRPARIARSKKAYDRKNFKIEY